MLFAFTFVTMVGGNPQHDAYGFRYWRNPGPVAEYRSTGTTGTWEGFLAAMWSASFCIVGPEYVSMVAGEAKHPRVYIANAFKTVYWRFGVFFILGALCVGIVVPYNDPVLVSLLAGTFGKSGTAAASPYVIAMNNLKIDGLPHLTNALMVTSIFSAGNTYTYAATRSLYGMAIEGRAPPFLKKVTKNGVPIYCFIVTMFFPLLSFLSLSNSSSKVLTWLLNLITAGGVIDYIVMCITYIFFYRAVKAQGIDRKTLPYCGWFQPYGTYFALAFETLVLIFYGYSSVSPFSYTDFITYYAMAWFAIVTFTGWKLIKRSKFVRASEADLIWERPQLEAYEAAETEPVIGFWREMLNTFTFRKNPTY